MTLEPSISILEAVHVICSNSKQIIWLWRNFDMVRERESVLRNIMHAIAQISSNGEQLQVLGSSIDTWFCIAHMSKSYNVATSASHPSSFRMALSRQDEGVKLVALAVSITTRVVGALHIIMCFLSPKKTWRHLPSLSGMTAYEHLDFAPHCTRSAIRAIVALCSPSALETVARVANSTEKHAFDCLLRVYHQLVVITSLAGLSHERDSTLSSLCNIVHHSLPIALQDNECGNERHHASQCTWRSIRASTALLCILEDAHELLDSAWHIIMVTVLRLASLQRSVLQDDEATWASSECLRDAVLRIPKFTTILAPIAFLELVSVLSDIARATLRVGTVGESDASATPAERMLAMELPASGEAAPLAFRFLIEVSMANMFRLQLIWVDVVDLLHEAAKETDDLLRGLATSAIIQITTKRIAGAKLPRFGAGVSPELSKAGACRICGIAEDDLAEICTLFHTDDDTQFKMYDGHVNRIVDQSELLETWKLLAQSRFEDVRACVIGGIHTLLQCCGQILDTGWPTIFVLLSGFAVDKSHSLSVNPETEGKTKCSSQASECAFVETSWKSFRLIVDDFLGLMPRQHLMACVSCLRAHATQKVDVNISLTALGMTWIIADFVTHTVQSSMWLEAGSRASLIDKQLSNGIWSELLSQLCSLLEDPRPEVRNCSANSLFSVLIGHGGHFSLDHWRNCLLDHVFPICRVHAVLCSSNSSRYAELDDKLEQLSERNDCRGAIVFLCPSGSQSDRNETHTLLLQGISRLFRNTLSVFVKAVWFEEAWRAGLRAGAEAAVMRTAHFEQDVRQHRQEAYTAHATTNVSLAGVDLILSMIRQASRATEWDERVCADAKKNVVNGVLRPVSARVQTSDLECIDDAGCEATLRDSITRTGSLVQAWLTLDIVANFGSHISDELAARLLQEMDRLLPISKWATYQQSKSTDVHILESVESVATALATRKQSSLRQSLIERRSGLSQRAALLMLNRSLVFTRHHNRMAESISRLIETCHHGNVLPIADYRSLQHPSVEVIWYSLELLTYQTRLMPGWDSLIAGLQRRLLWGEACAGAWDSAAAPADSSNSIFELCPGLGWIGRSVLVEASSSRCALPSLRYRYQSIKSLMQHALELRCTDRRCFWRIFGPLGRAELAGSNYTALMEFQRAMWLVVHRMNGERMRIHHEGHPFQEDLSCEVSVDEIVELLVTTASEVEQSGSSCFAPNNAIFGVSYIHGLVAGHILDRFSSLVWMQDNRFPCFPCWKVRRCVLAINHSAKHLCGDACCSWTAIAGDLLVCILEEMFDSGHRSMHSCGKIVTDSAEAAHVDETWYTSILPCIGISTFCSPDEVCRVASSLLQDRVAQQQENFLLKV